MLASLRAFPLARRSLLSSAGSITYQQSPRIRALRSTPAVSSSRSRTFASNGTDSDSSAKATGSPDLKPYFATTPIFYANADPHIGHLYSDIIADVLARYHGYMRSGYSAYSRTGEPVDLASIPTVEPVKSLLSTGTDEHGLKIQKVAEASNEDPRALGDRISQRFKQLADAANINYSRFIRTTDSEHKASVEHLWRTLRKNGWIYQGSHEGWYAISDEAFYPETQVHEVTVDGQKQMQSIETGAKVEWSLEMNYKFKLSAFQEPLMKWLKDNPQAIQPAQKYAEVLQEIESGLSDLSISRPRSRLQWGIPVPGDPEHTIYVWVDALTNYLTVAGYPGWVTDPSSVAKSTNAWPADVHVVGKDILRFHAIYWPALLLAAGLPPPKTVLAHSHWTMNKAKMSKSCGNVANPFEVISQFGLDPLRFFLMRVGGNFGSDSDYNPEVLVEYQRKYLHGQLGNLVSRICAPKIHARLSDFPRDEETQVLKRPSRKEVTAHLVKTLPGSDTDKMCQKLEYDLINLPGRVDALMQQFEVAKALEVILETVIGGTNKILQRLKPWAPSTHPIVALESVVLVTESLRISALLLQPFMPDKMNTLLNTLKIPASKRTHPKDLVVTDEEGRLVSHAVQRLESEDKPEPLFPRIDVLEPKVDVLEPKVDVLES
ncbi:hypothetical protein NDA18_005423 [Ustilago nuda]|nr:hypothetical protein NDA18_005423 [Ustilago nuda]